MRGRRKRLLIIGVDGASYQLIKRNQSKFSLFSKLLRNSDLCPLISTIPPSTVPAWMSIFTGVNPGKHGYFGFTEQHSYDYKLVHFNECRVPRVWNILNNYGLRSIVVNVPVVYPVEHIRGAMIAGMFSPENKLNERNIFPTNIVPLLERLSYIIDVSASELKNFSRREVHDKLSMIIEARTEVFKQLMDRFRADLGVLVYTETDRVQHVFWHDEELVLRIYELIDRKIKEIVDYFDSPIIIMSDHGFRETRKGLIMSTLLYKMRYLKFRKKYYRSLIWGLIKRVKEYGSLIEFEVIDWGRTLAYFKGDTWSIILNLLSRQPNGVIRRKEYNPVLNKLVRELEATSLFEQIHRSIDIYQGPYISKAPDVILIPRSDIKLLSLNEAIEIIKMNRYVGRIKAIKDIIISEDPITKFDKPIGEHDLYGIIGVHGGSFQNKPSIYDITPSTLKFFNIELPNYLDGRTIIEFEV